MNYRHAFHAGNHADVLKHVILSRLIALLSRKDAPFAYLDSHAGVGLYDLAGTRPAAPANGCRASPGCGRPRMYRINWSITWK